MRNTIKLFLLFFTVFFNAQELKKDTLPEKYTDIETVVINHKDYEKIDYAFGLKQEINSRVTAAPFYEMGLKFKNNLNQKGRISNVTLYLHKTNSNINITNLEINFYKINAITGNPEEKLNTQQIIYTPKNKSRGSVKINVEQYHIPFPLEGVLVAVKWLPNQTNDRNVGPSLRQTNYIEKLTYGRYKDRDWILHFSHSRKPNIYTNVMIGLEVYIRRKKNSDE